MKKIRELIKKIELELSLRLFLAIFSQQLYIFSKSGSFCILSCGVAIALKGLSLDAALYLSPPADFSSCSLKKPLGENII
jgi:hypothetical protein